MKIKTNSDNLILVKLNAFVRIATLMFILKQIVLYAYNVTILVLNVQINHFVLSVIKMINITEKNKFSPMDNAIVLMVPMIVKRFNVINVLSRVLLV